VPQSPRELGQDRNGERVAPAPENLGHVGEDRDVRAAAERVQAGLGVGRGGHESIDGRGDACLVVSLADQRFAQRRDGLRSEPTERGDHLAADSPARIRAHRQ
jgi:hypothetical protein